MKHLYIPQPCSEDWNAMLPTKEGAFCYQCSKEVIDFTVLTHNELKYVLYKNRENGLCGRFYNHQMETFNAEMNRYSFRSTKSFQSALVFSLIVVFGFTLFSCTDQQQQREVELLRTTVQLALKNVESNQDLPETENPEIVEKDSIPKRKLVSVKKDGWANERTAGMPVISEKLFDSYPVSKPDTITDIVEEIPVADEILPPPTLYDAIIYPNPTTGPATFKIDLVEKQAYFINLVNGSGQLVDKVHDGMLDNGTFRHEIDLSNQPPGMYYLTVQSATFQTTLKISKL